MSADSRFARRLAALAANGRKALVPFITAGDPGRDATVPVLHALVAAGADLIELGVPFSDPLADGLTNQLAAQRALENGMTAARVFEFVKKIREFSEVPVVFYTYYNLVFSNGIEAYVKAAKAAGVDGMLVLDLPPEEGAEFSAAVRAHGIDSVCIVAPKQLATSAATLARSPNIMLSLCAQAQNHFLICPARSNISKH